MWVYKLVVWLFSCFFKLRGVQITGLENLLAEGSVVVMANHTHWADPFYMAVAYKKRQIHFMAKEEFFRFKPLGAFINYIGSFSINRGDVDIAALKKSLAYLKKQEVLGIFPEGTRNKSSQKLLDFKDGATLIAYKSKAAIIPMGIQNSKNWFAFWRPKPKLCVGAPIYFAETQEKIKTAQIVEKYTEQCKKNIEDLLQ